MYLTFLKKRILTGLWFFCLLLLASVLNHVHCAAAEGASEACRANQTISLIVMYLCTISCGILSYAYLFGYQWWGFPRESWRHGEAKMPAFSSNTQTGHNFGLNGTDFGVLLAISAMLIGSAYEFTGSQKPSSIPSVEDRTAGSMPTPLKENHSMPKLQIKYGADLSIEKDGGINLMKLMQQQTEKEKNR